jgi:hypothetical protein
MSDAYAQQSARQLAILVKLLPENLRAEVLAEAGRPASVAADTVWFVDLPEAADGPERTPEEVAYEEVMELNEQGMLDHALAVLDAPRVANLAARLLAEWLDTFVPETRELRLASWLSDARQAGGL